MKTIRIPLDYDDNVLDYDSKMKNDRVLGLCGEELEELWSIGRAKKIDLIISDKQFEGSYKVRLDKSMVIYQTAPRVKFLDVETEPDLKVQILFGAYWYIQKNLPGLFNKEVYVGIEI